MASQGETVRQDSPINCEDTTMSDTNVHMELVDQRNEEERWREEAARRLAPVPGQREALEAGRQRQQAQENPARHAGAQPRRQLPQSRVEIHINAPSRACMVTDPTRARKR